MSVANRYKRLSLNGSQVFAMLRAMATREAHLLKQIAIAEELQEAAIITSYLDVQLVDLRATRAIFSSTPYTDGAV